MKEKQLVIISMIVGLVLLGTGYALGRLERKTVNVFPPNYHTEDMEPVIGKPQSITVTLIDSVDGRPSFYIEFPDSTKIVSMYPEEIANGLNTGVWTYNEMLQLKERQ
jgi:hypothetical protein